MRKGKRKNKLLLPLVIIIPFLSFFLYCVLSLANPFVVIYANIFPFRSNVKYDTFTISFDESASENVKNEVVSSLQDITFNNKKRFEFVDRNGKYQIKSSNPDAQNIIVENSLVPVGHIYWLRDSVSEADLRQGKFKILVNNESVDRKRAFLTDALGNIEVISSENIVSDLKKSESSIGFVAPSEITKEMKVLKLDGNYFLDSPKGSLESVYALESKESDLEFVYSLIKKRLGESSVKSFDRENIVKINMTGVTAIARDLAAKIDAAKDYDYPAKKIGEFLADADLTHTSNEVSFVKGCAVYTGMRFCANPLYIETLKTSGIDIVELTGNHNNDFGAQNNTNTINTYKEEGMEYFGGGLDATDAEKILYKQVKGSTIAFVGYNYYDTMLNSGAIASNSHAGSNSYSVSKLQKDITEAKENADVVIVDFQFQECYSYPSSDVIYPICYKPLSNPDQKAVFRQAIDFGADIVIGTQAHQPQTYEAYNGGLIYYGLGNLYFDQNEWIGTRQGLVISLYIVDGELIQSELTATMYDNDLITRLATESEANVLFDQLKKARNF